LDHASVEGVATTEASGNIGQQQTNRNRSARVRKHRKRAVKPVLQYLAEDSNPTNDALPICKKITNNNTSTKNNPEMQHNKATTRQHTSTSNGHHTSNTTNNRTNNTNKSGDINQNTRRHHQAQERKQQKRRLNMRAMRPTKVPINVGIHGNRLKPKEFGFTRIAFENFNSLGVGAKPGRNSEYVKVTKLRRLIRQLDLDILGGSEVRANWTVLGEAKSLVNTFRSETDFRCVTGHNIHEQYSSTQEGGTCVMTFDQVATKVTATGTDTTGLGRWCSLLFKGKNDHLCRVITAYQPVKQGQNGHFSSVYAQHRRYFRSQHNDFTCPRILFIRHLLAEIQKCIKNGEKVILLMDANECLETGKLAKGLTNLGMHDAIKTRTGLKGPATFAFGQRQIDGIWISDSLRASSGSFLPLYVGIGDHRIPIIDIPNDMLLGESLHRVTRVTARRLQTKLPGTGDNLTSSGSKTRDN
jgi:hypothetical protein